MVYVYMIFQEKSWNRNSTWIGFWTLDWMDEPFKVIHCTECVWIVPGTITE